MKRCEFKQAWIGQCNVFSENDYCEGHSKDKCCSCGEQATHTCSETMQLVCGAPLCDNCEHTVRSNGYNSGGEPLPKGLKGHCKKEDQIYKPWWDKKEEE